MKKKKILKDRILNPISMLMIGLLTGIIVKLIDIHFYVQYFGFSLSDLFSEMGIWILFGVLISLFSKSRKYAMINVFLFNIGMLTTYYITAHLMNSVYGFAFIKGWTIFAFLSPIMAYFITLIKYKGKISYIIKFGIILVYILTKIIIFQNEMKIYDFCILIVLIYLLFVKKYYDRSF